MNIQRDENDEVIPFNSDFALTTMSRVIDFGQIDLNYLNGFGRRIKLNLQKDSIENERHELVIISCQQIDHL